MSATSMSPSKKLAYIATPVAFFFIGRTPKSALNTAITHAKKVSKIAKDMGYIPISLPMSFLKIYDEKTERDMALRDCLSVLKRCDVFFYLQKDLPLSVGMSNELEMAQDLKLEIVEIKADI